MLNQFSRTELIYGRDAMEMLKDARVAVFGIGGVGGYTVEALARSGVGSLDLIDDDKVCLTNINRQIYATRKTVGQYKVDVAAERIKDINPDAVVRTYKTFYTPETADQFDFKHYDYIVDAIDTVTGKIALVMNAKAAKTPIICSMGAGNKVDPTAFEVTDLYKTSAGEGYAQRAEKARRAQAESGLLQRAAHHTRGRHGHKLPHALHLPAGHREKVHAAPPSAGQQRFCAVRCGTHHRGRSHQRSDRLQRSRHRRIIYLDYAAMCLLRGTLLPRGVCRELRP